MTAVANVGIRIDAGGAIAQLNRLNASANNLNGSFGKLKDTAGRLGTAIAGLGLALAGKQAVSAAASYNDLQNRLRLLTSEYGEFKQAQDLVARSAKIFGLSNREAAQGITDIFARLRPLGVSLRDIESTFVGFNTVAKLSGVDAYAASAAFTQLAQALGSGTLRGDEFNSIAEQVPGLLTAISQETGIAQGKLRAYAAEGKITSESVINALKRVEQEGAGKIKQLIEDSDVQKFKDFQNAADELSVSIGSKLLPILTPALKQLTKLINGFAELPGPIQTAIVAVVGLSAAAAILGPIIGTLVAGVSSLGPAATAAATALATLGGGAATTVTGFTAAGAAITTTTTAVTAGTVALGAFGAALIALPIVGVGLAIADATRRKEEFDAAMRTTDIDVLSDKVSELTARNERLKQTLEGIQNGQYYRGMTADIVDLKAQIADLDVQIDQATRRRQLIIEIVADVRSRAIKDFDKLSDAEIAEGLRLAGVSSVSAPIVPRGSIRSGGGTPPAKPRNDTEAANQLLESLRRRIEALKNVTALERALNQITFENLDIQEQIKKLQNIDPGLRKQLTDRADLLKQGEEQNAIMDDFFSKLGQQYTLITNTTRPLEEQRRILEATLQGRAEEETMLIQIENLTKGLPKPAAEYVETLIRGNYATKKQLEYLAQLDQVYKSIGDAITTGIVDSLTAAVEGTKTLAEIASDTLRSIANILIQFGVRSLLGGLGGGDPNSIFTKIFGGARAGGGRVSSNRSYVVGERGPELFVPRSSGTIVPNNALGGGTANVTVNVDASGSNVQGDNNQASQLGKAIGIAVQAELVKQKRPGGLLAGT